ncbi:AAA domain-containing protein [uncultured Helicobacter sp.]|uniref:AAA domain-containing protein n=1 Tax=uncultured Helicobacter sp. TaxID=175537 RepID=UPI002601CFDC|nr:AAA domain-containing protein [uncultured Helicobacter sp.]
MNDLKQILLSAAHIYYQYLSDNNLGLNEIAIKQFECRDDELILALKYSVGDMDLKLGGALLLQVGDRLYRIAEADSPKESEVMLHFYDEKQRTLFLNVSEAMAKMLEKAQKAKIPLKLFSDLKFLVQNVADFFDKYGEKLRLPSSIVHNPTPHIPRLSEEQNIALSKVLNSPLSYVWGPPGTGKTQAVLFEALLYYIKQGKRVGVVATTNNALEQVLKALIKQFDNLGLARDMILRLGMPTLQYMSEYPQTCDPSLLQKRKKLDLFSFQESTQDNIKIRLKNAFVVGVTLDGFISRYDKLDLHFSHIFLDECAYASLIKTCALCVDNTPLALFGDHKQLSPVCEMPPNKLTEAENNNAFVWNLSALFLEAFCKGESPAQLANMNEQGYSMPPLQDTILSTLSKTHRYGDNLARLLDNYVYHIGLRGTEMQMELFVVDSGAKSESDKQISENEAQMCARLCEKIANEEYAVITPFVKQRQRLVEQIKRDRVFTIHGSQGQEFDNVIFSPVSLHYYLTNSTQAHALYALNVAISRTKKRLFIVCDYAFWSRQKGQLIWAILQESKPFVLT